MLGLMLRCAQCGHENNPQYRFCGMCGARLQAMPPPSPAAQPQPHAPAVSGPSFLGLAEEQPSGNFQYLLEDDVPSGHGRLYTLLAILLFAAIFLGWRWHRDGYPWGRARPGESVTAAPAGTAAQTSIPAPAVSAATNQPEAAPAPGASEKIDLGPLQPAAPAADANKSAAPPPQDTEKGSEPPSSKTPANETVAANSIQPQSTADSEADQTPPKQTEPSSPPTPAKKKPAAPAPKLAEERPADSAAADDDRLVVEGEKYLYGNGVPQSCGLAQKNLFTAAQRANPKAQSVLGAMYATGHCVNRDLPAAYRWFAKALRQEPANERVAQDLEVLWKQMTPAEKRAASHSEQ